jgi:hypothetical protein
MVITGNFLVRKKKVEIIHCKVSGIEKELVFLRMANRVFSSILFFETNCFHVKMILNLKAKSSCTDKGLEISSLLS